MSTRIACKSRPSGYGISHDWGEYGRLEYLLALFGYRLNCGGFVKKVQIFNISKKIRYMEVFIFINVN